MHSFQRIKAYRAEKFRLLPKLRISDLDAAVEFVNERGFVYFWPIKGITLPSLWAAVAGDRPVADAHDDPGHITWRWKDTYLGGKHWYYAKVLRKKATMISFELAPYFYALSENFGSLEDDYLTLYEQGRMTQEAKAVYEILLSEGSMDTIALRRATRLSSKLNESRFNRALADLQADFKILPVAVTEAGGWRYAFAYDIVARHYPELVEQARFIGDAQARARLVETYLISVGAAGMGEVQKLFQWGLKETKKVIDRLVQNKRVKGPIRFENQPGDFFYHCEIEDFG